MSMTYEELAALLPFLRDSEGNPKETLRAQYEAILPIAEAEVLAYIGYEGGDYTEYGTVHNCTMVLTHHPVNPDSIVCHLNDEDGEVVDCAFDRRCNALKFPRGTADIDVYVEYNCGWGDNWDQEERPGIINLAIARTIQHWSKFDNSAMVGTTSRSTDMGSETIEQSELPIIVKQSLTRFRHEVLA